MADIFLSYSRKDKKIMRQVRSFLRSNFSVWTDEDIPVGDNWRLRLPVAIANSHCFVVICSEEAQKSNWVTNEILHALNLDKPIFPILLTGSMKDELPFQLNHLQPISIDEDIERALGFLIESLAPVIGFARARTQGTQESLSSQNISEKFEQNDFNIPSYEVSDIKIPLLGIRYSFDTNKRKQAQIIVQNSRNDFSSEIAKQIMKALSTNLDCSVEDIELIIIKKGKIDVFK